jgi:cation diffusion facilitator family transporter
VHEALQRLFSEHEPVRMSIWAFLVMLVSIGVDFSRSRMLSAVAKKYNSQALEADALHFSTDILSSAVVIFGLGAVWAAELLPAGSFWQKALMRADSLAALVVALLVAWVSISLGRKAVDTLLDGGDSAKLEAIEAAVAGVPQVVRISRLRLRESGPASFVDMSLVLPTALSLEEGHATAELAEKAVRVMLPAADVTVHFEPENTYGPESFMDQIRHTAQQQDLHIHAVKTYRYGDRLYVVLHAEVDGELSLAQAHAQVAVFEKSLEKRGCEVLTHIEPQSLWESNTGRLLKPEDSLFVAVQALIEEVARQEEDVFACHKVRLIVTEHTQTLSFHCNMPGTVSVKDAHESTTRMARYIRQHCPSLTQIDIHADPPGEE